MNRGTYAWCGAVAALLSIQPQAAVGAPVVPAKYCPAPARLPDFAVPLDIRNAGVIARRDVGARPAFIYFYSGENPASLKMLPAVQRIFAKYHSKGLVVIAMQQAGAPSLEKPAQNDPAPVRRLFHLGFPVGRDSVGAGAVFCVSTVPDSLFYDRYGRLVNENPTVLSSLELERIVTALLGAPAPGGKAPGRRAKGSAI